MQSSDTINQMFDKIFERRNSILDEMEYMTDEIDGLFKRLSSMLNQVESISDELVNLEDVLAQEYDAIFAKAVAEIKASLEATRKQENLICARNFKNDGIPIDIIAKNTGLSVAEVESAQ